MPDSITLRLDDREVRRNLRKLTEKELPKALAKALNRTAFEVLDAEKKEVKSIFDFAGPSTERFLSGKGSFRFDKATPSKLDVAISPRKKTGEILEPHQRGAVLTPKSPRRFVIEGKLATPIEAKRTARGRVRKSRAKRFVAGRAVLERVRGRVRVAFALSATKKLRQRFDFYRTVQRTAEREFPRKVRSEVEKIRLGK
jgi:hypothetical protein